MFKKFEVDFFQSEIGSKLSVSEKEFLEKNSFYKHFKKGDIIVSQGSPINYIVYCCYGLTKVHAKSGNNSRIISVIKDSNFFNLSTSFVCLKHECSLTALSSSLFCFIELSAFKSVIINNGMFALEIIHRLGLRERLFSKFIVASYYRQNPGKVAHVLLQFSNEIYEKPDFVLPLTRKEFSEYIRIARENVSRILKDFQDNGLILIDNNRITILNKELLTLISEKG